METKKIAMILFALAIIAGSAFATKDYMMATISSEGATGGTSSTTGGTAGGGGGGSSGGTTTETILETTLNNTITAEELAAILIDAGYTAEQAEEAKELLGKAEITQTLVVEKTTGAGPTTYKSTVTITIKNPSNMDWKDVKVVVEIPKLIAASAAEITSPLSFITLKADPIIEFIVDIPTGTTKTITWSVAKEVTSYQLTQIKAPIIAGFQEVEPATDYCKLNNVNCDDGNPCTIDSCEPTTGQCSNAIVADNTPCGSNSVCRSGQCTVQSAGAVTGGELLPWWAILLIALIIIGAAYYFTVMKKEEKKK